MLRSVVFALVLMGAAGNAALDPAAAAAATEAAAAADPAAAAAIVAPALGAAPALGEAKVEAEEIKTVPELEEEIEKLEAELEEKIEESKEPRPDAGLVLLVAVAGVMVLFYLVNSKEEEKQKSTWHVLSTAVSIFVAVMLNTCVAEIFIVFGVEGEDAKLISKFGYLIGWWLSAVLILWLDQGSPLRLMGWGTVYGHILGFAAIGAYGGVAESETFNGSHWMTLAVIGIYLVSIPFVLLPTALLGKCLKNEQLHDQCQETAIDFFCMGLSFLISMFFRGWIKYHRTHAAAGVEADGTGSETGEVVLMVAVGLVYLVGACVAHCFQQKSKPTKESKPTGMYMFWTVSSTVNSMTCAWCWLDAASWVSLSRVAPNSGHEGRRLNAAAPAPVVETGLAVVDALINATNATIAAAGHEIAATEPSKTFSIPKSVFMANLMVALFFTLVFVLAVYIFGCAHNHLGKNTRALLKGSMTAVALVFGLSWEHLFDTAIEEAAEMAKSEKAAQWLKIAFSLVLVIVVTPAWMVYVLPKHNEELIEQLEGKHLTPFNCLGDCFDTDDEGGSEGEAAE